MTAPSRYFESWDDTRRHMQEKALPEIPTATCLTLDSTEAIVRSEVRPRGYLSVSLSSGCA